MSIFTVKPRIKEPVNFDFRLKWFLAYIIRTKKEVKLKWLLPGYYFQLKKKLLLVKSFRPLIVHNETSKFFMFML